MYHVSMIKNGYIEFEWDERKAAVNVKKHGVSFESAADAFSDPYARVLPDAPNLGDITKIDEDRGTAVLEVSK